MRIAELILRAAQARAAAPAEARYTKPSAELVEARRAVALEDSLSTIPAGFAWASLDSPELAERTDMAALKLARERRQRPLLALWGPSGTGKTSVAVALLRERLNAAARPDGLFVGTVALVREAREAKLGEVHRLAARCRSVEALVLDDLGQEPAGEWDRVVLETIHERHAAQRWTVVTTYLDRDALAARYGGGTARRLRERGAIEFRGRSR